MFLYPDPKIPQCGVANNNRRRRQFEDFEVDKIVGGTEVQPNSIPWQARIHFKIPDSESLSCPWMDDGTITCAGSVISPVHILTAAWCVQYPTCTDISAGQPDGFQDFGPEDIVVTLGDHSVFNTNEKYEKTLEVGCISKHPAWSFFETYITEKRVNIKNNAAILTLKEPLDLESPQSKIKPVCIITEDIEQNNILDSSQITSLRVSGWGQMVGGVNTLTSDTLLMAEVPYLGVDTGVCLNNVPPEFANQFFDESMMCTGNIASDSLTDEPGPFRKGACSGDYGGKYFLTTNTNYQ